MKLVISVKPKTTTEMSQAWQATIALFPSKLSLEAEGTVSCVGIKGTVILAMA